MRKLIENLYSLLVEGESDERFYKLGAEEGLTPEEFYVAEMLMGLNPGGRKDAIQRYGLNPEVVKKTQEALAKKGYAKVNKAGAVAATPKTKALHDKVWGLKIGQFTFYHPPKGLLK
jgi:hypothetical protein